MLFAQQAEKDKYDDLDMLKQEELLLHNRSRTSFVNEETQKDFLAYGIDESKISRRIVYTLLVLMLFFEIVISFQNHTESTEIWAVLISSSICYIIIVGGFYDTLLPAEHYTTKQYIGLGITSIGVLLSQQVIFAYLPFQKNHDIMMMIMVAIVLIGLRIPFKVAIISGLTFPLHVTIDLVKSKEISLYVHTYYFIAILFSVVMCWVFENNLLNRYTEMRCTEILWKHRQDAANARATALAQVKTLSTMSHELRTPLTAVIGASSLLVESNVDPEHLHLAQIILSGAHTTLDLVNSVMDFSKLESGEVVITKQPTPLSSLIDDCMDILRPVAKKKNIDFTVNIENGLNFSTVMLDRGRTKQIILNFGSNAIKFTPKNGTVSLDICLVKPDAVDDGGDGEDMEGTRRIKSKVYGNTDMYTNTNIKAAAGVPQLDVDSMLRIRFSVKDSGPGIPSAKLDSVFRPFVQVHDDSVGTQVGTGLGLSISCHIAELMGGCVWAESAPGEGSIFVYENTLPTWLQSPAPQRFTAVKTTADHCAIPASSATNSTTTITKLPNESVGAVAKPVEMEVDTNTISNLKVLVAEDQQLNQLIVGKMLKKANCNYELCNDGIEVLDTYTANPSTYFVIFMDLQMPNMSGYEATKAIRAFEKKNGLDHVPIVALTAEALPQDRSKCLLAGMTGYLTKPIEYESLKSEVLRQAAAMRKNV